MWDAVQRGAGRHLGRVWTLYRGAGRVAWSGAGHRGTLGAVWGRVGLDRGADSGTAGQRDRGGQCARLDSETGSKWGCLGGVKDRVIYPHVCIGHIIPSCS